MCSTKQAVTGARNGPHLSALRSRCRRRRRLHQARVTRRLMRLQLRLLVGRQQVLLRTVVNLPQFAFVYLETLVDCLRRHGRVRQVRIMVGLCVMRSGRT